MIAVVLGLSLLLSLAPVPLLVGALVSPLLPGRWRPLRLLAFLLVYLALEVVALVVAFLLYWALATFFPAERMEPAAAAPEPVG